MDDLKVLELAWLHKYATFEVSDKWFAVDGNSGSNYSRDQDGDIMLMAAYEAEAFEGSTLPEAIKRCFVQETFPFNETSLDIPDEYL